MKIFTKYDPYIFTRLSAINSFVPRLTFRSTHLKSHTLYPDFLLIHVCVCVCVCVLNPLTTTKKSYVKDHGVDCDPICN